MSKIKFENLRVSFKERVLLNSFLNSKDFILSNQVKSFEEEFAKFNNVQYCVGLNSGTDAIYLTLKSFDIGKGHQVIMQANTVPAVVLAVARCGAKPILVDIDINDDQFNITAEAVKRHINDHTKAIIVTHMFGKICKDIEEIIELARTCCKAIVIEDASHAVGAALKTKHIGTYGDVGCFSFYPTKNLGAIGDAGCIVLNDKNRYMNLRMLRNSGSITSDLSLDTINSRMDELQACILRYRLKKLKKNNRKRILIAEQYKRELQSLEESGYLMMPKNDSPHVYHQFVVMVGKQKRFKLKEYLEKKGITTLIHYPYPYYATALFDIQFKFKNTKIAAQRSLSLPMNSTLSRREVSYVCKETINFFEREI